MAVNRAITNGNWVVAPAGDGDAGEQRAITAQQGQHLGHRHLARLGAGVARAGIQATVAIGAKRLASSPALLHGQGAARATGHAVAAVIAQPRCVGLWQPGQRKLQPCKTAPAGCRARPREGERQPAAHRRPERRPLLHPSTRLIQEGLIATTAVPLADPGQPHSPGAEAGGLQPRALCREAGHRRACGSCSRSPAPDRCRPRWR